MFIQFHKWRSAPGIPVVQGEIALVFMTVKMRQVRSLLSLSPLHHFRGYQRALGPRLSPGAFLGQRSEERGLLQCSVLLSQMENTFAKEGKMDFPQNTVS